MFDKGVQDTNEIRDHYRKFFDNTFMPIIRHEQMADSEERIAYAAEFAAHQLGLIDGKLGRLIKILERKTTQSA